MGVALRLLILACLALLGPAAAAQEPPPLNFVVVLTDDQPFHTMWAMPITQQELGGRGVTWSQAYVSTPACCPFRASFLAGGFYARNTGVLENPHSGPNGGVSFFEDAETLATLLQGSGYATGLIGKYMNGYKFIWPYIPPGWTRFEGSLGSTLISPFYLAAGSATDQSAMGTLVGPVSEPYGTDYLRDRALAFLDAHADEPFFLLLSTHAPHAPATPPPGDENLFSDYVYRERGYGEVDVSDKPPRVQTLAAEFPARAAAVDAFHRDQLRTLQAVDRAVGALVERLTSLGVLDRTVIVFTSDNGYLWGEHGMEKKGESYEESIRVPLITVVPGIAPRSDDGLVAVDLDLPQTILDLAGISFASDGQSLMPVLEDPLLPGRRGSAIEFWTPWMVWSGLRVRDATGFWKYVEYGRGYLELYDLANDPFELENLATAPQHQALIADLAAEVDAGRGLAITNFWATKPRRGHPFAMQLTAWGGEEPYLWSILEGSLPTGLSLDAATGRVSGVAELREEQTLTIVVTDSSVASQTGRSQRYRRDFTFKVLGACEDGVDDDGDGRTDAADPACYPGALDESPECNDGQDDDADGNIDFDGGAGASRGGILCTGPATPFDCCSGPGTGCAGPPDPECLAAWDESETRLGCGLGPLLLALLVPLLGRLARRR